VPHSPQHGSKAREGGVGEESLFAEKIGGAVWPQPAMIDSPKERNQDLIRGRGGSPESPTKNAAVHPIAGSFARKETAFRTRTGEPLYRLVRAKESQIGKPHGISFCTIEKTSQGGRGETL